MRRALKLGMVALLLLGADAFPPEDLISSLPPLTVAPQELGGKVLPANHGLQLTAVSLHVAASGIGGSTNANFRVTDGTNTCDCAFACNVSPGNKRVECVANGGTGCLFSPSASITYSWSAAGNCGTPPVILGNVDVNGVWQ